MYRRSPVGRVAVIVLLALLMLNSCAKASVPRGGGSGPSSTAAGALVHRDLAYGSDPAQQLDVYQPAGASGDPIIVMVHGGGWQRGDKGASGVADNKVAHYLPKGYVVVSTNYRLSPTVDPVTEAHDVAAALAYTQQHAQDWGGDAHRVVLMGHSAGANLVSLVAADPSYAKQTGAAPWLGTVSLDSAAYNVVDIMQAPHLSLYDPVFAQNRQLWQAASPTLQLSGRPAPMLLVCGTGRADSCPQAQAFAAAAETLGTRTQVDPVDLRHGEIDSELGTPGALTTTVDTFLRTLGLP